MGQKGSKPYHNARTAAPSGCQVVSCARVDAPLSTGVCQNLPREARSLHMTHFGLEGLSVWLPLGSAYDT